MMSENCDAMFSVRLTDILCGHGDDRCMAQHLRRNPRAEINDDAEVRPRGCATRMTRFRRTARDSPSSVVPCAYRWIPHGGACAGFTLHGNTPYAGLPRLLRAESSMNRDDSTSMAKLPGTKKSRSRIGYFLRDAKEVSAPSM